MIFFKNIYTKGFYFISGAAGALTAMIIKRLGFAEKYWSLLFTINGGLTGMVRDERLWVVLKQPLDHYIHLLFATLVRNEKQAGASYISQSLVGPLLGTKWRPFQTTRPQ